MTVGGFAGVTWPQLPDGYRLLTDADAPVLEGPDGFVAAFGPNADPDEIERAAAEDDRLAKRWAVVRRYGDGSEAPIGRSLARAAAERIAREGNGLAGAFGLAWRYEVRRGS